jgi:hypothetical protein
MSKSKSAKPALRPGAARKPAQVVTSLAGIEAWHKEPIGVEVALGDQPFKLTGRRLLPVEERQIKELLERALPPRLAGEPGAEDRYDLMDEGYRSRKEECRRTARALALWWGFPVFASDFKVQNQVAHLGTTKPEDLKQILDFIESRNLPDQVLEVLFGALTLPVTSVVEFTGFISGSNSPKS